MSGVLVRSGVLRSRSPNEDSTPPKTEESNGHIKSEELGVMCVLTDISALYTLDPGTFIFRSFIDSLLAIWCCKDFYVSFLFDRLWGEKFCSFIWLTH